MKFIVTKKQCKENIEKLGNVCDRCGRNLQPLRTVDNSGNPTYWIGCMHGQKEKGAWGHFTNGASKSTYNLAVKLVLENDRRFGITRDDIELGDFDYAFQNAVSRAVLVIRDIEYMKVHKPRFSKEEIKKQYLAQSSKREE